MKRYLLFFGDHYYPAGGWLDLHSSYDHAADAIGKGMSMMRYSHHETPYPMTWFHVIDSQTGEEVG